MNFVKEIENLFDIGIRTFIEVGPKSVLTGLVKAILKDRDIQAISMDDSAGKKSGISDLARSLAHLASLGYPVKLKDWEDPEQDPEKKRMNIPICGANYRSPSSSKKSSEDFGELSRTVEKKNSKVIQKSSEDFGELSRTVSKMVRLSSPKSSELFQKQVNNKSNKIMGRNIISTMDKDNQREFSPEQECQNFILAEKRELISFPVTDALSVVQEGLKSMQSLQMQTTEAHKKFLETQSEASRTLREMMESTRHLAEISMGIRRGTGVRSQESKVKSQKSKAGSQKSEVRSQKPEDRLKAELQTVRLSSPKSANRPPKGGTTNGSTERSTERSRRSLTEVSQQPLKADSQQPTANNQQLLDSKLLEVVSELTGYPIEMLSLDMNIEADLGIDSIKRVEILSTLEEKMPGLPPVSPEIMGTLKTLGQISDYLAKIQKSEVRNQKPEVRRPPKGGTTNGSTELTEVSQQLPPKGGTTNGSTELTEVSQQLPPKGGTTSSQSLDSQLLKVVSELTGYPMEMLSLDMDIESDLGIDSIKRVEILSSLEEKMPGLPSVSPEIMGTLKTLRQIAEYLGQESGVRSQEPTANIPPKGGTTNSQRFDQAVRLSAHAEVLTEVSQRFD